MPHFKFFKKKNTRGRMMKNNNNNLNNNNNNNDLNNLVTTSTSHGLNAGGLPINNNNDVDVKSVRKNGVKEKKNWKIILLKLHQNTTNCCFKIKNSRKFRNKNNNNSIDVIDGDEKMIDVGDEKLMDYVDDDGDEKMTNYVDDDKENDKNVIKETNDPNDLEDPRDRDVKKSTSSSSLKSLSKQQMISEISEISENDARKVNVSSSRFNSRFISTSNTSNSNTNTKNIIDNNLLLKDKDSRDDEFDLIENDKTKKTLIEKYSTFPRRSSETEVLARKGRFTIIREADNTCSSRESNKSISSSYSSYCSTLSQSCSYSSSSSSCSSLPPESPDSLTCCKGTTKIRKNNELVLTSVYFNSPLSLFSPYYSNSPMHSSPLSSSFGSISSNHYYYNNKNTRRASDSVAHHAHHYNNNFAHKSIIPTSSSPPKSNIIIQQNISYSSSPTSSSRTSPRTTPTSSPNSTLIPKSSTNSTIKPNNILIISQPNTQTQTKRDSTSYPDTPHSTTSTTSATTSTTTSIVSTPSGRIFELESSYFPIVSPISNNNLGSKRRRKFIIETCE